MNVEDRVIIPGYIYFRDNGMDYKFGLTNNPVVRGRAYKTENPRDTVLDVFQVDTYAEAETIETEMKKVARTEGLCSFDNSDEWIERKEESRKFWDRYVLKYAKKTFTDWGFHERTRELTSRIVELEKDLERNQELAHKTLMDRIAELEEKLEHDQQEANKSLNSHIDDLEAELEEAHIREKNDDEAWVMLEAKYYAECEKNRGLRKKFLQIKRRIEKKRAKFSGKAKISCAYWGVFNSGMKRRAVFEYYDKHRAEKLVKDLSYSSGDSHFIQLIKEPIAISTK